MYDELELDTLGDKIYDNPDAKDGSFKKTALFLIMSDTDSTFNFLISMIYSQLFNLLCEKADDQYKGRLSGLFDTVNTRVGEIAGQVGATPQGWNGGIYNMIRSLSDNVILPIAGVILAIVMTMELIQIITDKNNMHGEVDTWFIFKWVFKTACAVLIVSNTWNIVMDRRGKYPRAADRPGNL